MNPDVKSTVAEVEPTSAVTPLPVWLVVGTLLVMLWSAVAFDRNGALMDPKVYHPYRSMPEVERFQMVKGANRQLEIGKKLFMDNCSLCHNIDGTGKPGQGPPFVGSEWISTKGVNRLIRIPQVGLSGPIKVAGQDFNLNMGGMGAPYSDEQLAAVLTYIRATFGKAGPVTPEQVKKVRADLGNRMSPYAPDEIMKLDE